MLVMMKAVLWDFGGVILTSPFEAFRRYETEHHLPIDFIRGVNTTNPHANAWALLERNETTPEQFDTMFAAESEALGHRVAGADVLSLLAGDVRPEMVDMLDRVKAAGYLVACLTNNVIGGDGRAAAGDAPAQQIAAIMDRFDVIVESSKVGVRKPEPRFYEIACELLGVQPPECVFLDDLGINLKPAAAMGMTTIKVTNAKQAIVDLTAALGWTCNDPTMETRSDDQVEVDSVRARTWLPAWPQQRESTIRDAIASLTGAETVDLVETLIERNRQIHEVECINLNPATNVMNPRAEAALAAGLGSRPSLGYAGEKYEMGLEAIEEIEVIAADLACRVFDARFAEIRVGSGALANLYAFMATCQPGDSIIVTPPSIGGHITHRRAGAAGLYGLDIHECPIDARRFTIDLQGLAELARQVRPKLITMGASLNLLPHPVTEVREIADTVGAAVLFDAAHACGMFAGRVWPNPLALGADLMTMSTYKSLGGPPGGLLLTNSADLAERVDAIAYPGLTANFDAGKTASLAITLLDWLDGGLEYAAEMVATASALANELAALGMPVFSTEQGYTMSHQFAVDAAQWNGGHQAALVLRDANILACAIGLPGGDEWSGLRLGTPEIVRWGMTVADMPELASLIVDALRGDAAAVAAKTTAFRSRFTTLHHIHA